MANNIWLISDTHFSHCNIIKYCNRPFSDEYEMDSIMIHNWNSVIGKNDIVFHIGDFAAGVKNRYDYIKEIAAQLNGTKVLIKGNHDYFSDDFYINELGITSVLDHFILSEDILLYHYPNDPKNREGRFGIGLKEKFNCKFVVHGHYHGVNTDIPFHYNVCVDRHDFRPLKLEFVEEMLNKNLGI